MGWREVVSKNGAEDILKISAKEPEIKEEDAKANSEEIAGSIIAEAVSAAGAVAAEAVKEAADEIETKNEDVYQNM
jgi:hypothetical protein